MKLVFPGGQHPQFLLGPGITRVGSDPAANLVLDHAGVQRMHCELNVGSHGVSMTVPTGAPVSVNGRPVAGLIALRGGDVVDFNGVHARLAALGASVARIPVEGAAAVAPDDDLKATTVRPSLPRYVLRGVSGAGFGRTFPLLMSTTLGRGPDCGITLDYPGLSRQHARLTPTEDGLLVEDLGSTNGCLINDVRVERGLARHGDELGFDVVRMRVVEPGHDESAAAPNPTHRRPLRWWWLVVTLVGAAAAGIWVLL